MFALIQEAAEDFEDLLGDPFALMVFLYPVELLITTIVVVIRSLINIKYATAENAKLPKRPSTNCILMLLIGLYASLMLMLVWNNFEVFSSLFILYALPGLALMIVNAMIKSTAKKIATEAEKEVAVQAVAAPVAQTVAVAADAPVEETVAPVVEKTDKDSVQDAPNND